MGFRWMRWHDLDYKSPDGPVTANLCHPEQYWLEEPDYVEDSECARSSLVSCTEQWEKRWTGCKPPREWWYPGGVPFYTTRADHDLLVLRLCMGDNSMLDYFIEAIDEIVARNGLPIQIAYEPGMWSEAAYITFNRKMADHEEHPMTAEEADAAYDAAPSIPITATEIADIVERVTGYRPDKDIDEEIASGKLLRYGSIEALLDGLKDDSP